MSPGPELVRAATAPSPAARPAAPLRQAATPAPTSRLAIRVRGVWLPRLAWTVSRTGRPGLVGLALLAAAALFLLSTHLPVVAEVEGLRADLASAQRRGPVVAVDPVAEPAAVLRALPTRTDVPTVLRQLFGEATRARLSVDTAKYEVIAMKSSGVVRYQITFPVTGPYPQIRAFIDAALATMPAVALSDLALERKSIADGDVEAQVRMTVYTRGAP